MVKQVRIIENPIDEPEESRDEIVQQVNESPPPPPPPSPADLPKAEAKSRIRELYRCELCNKYLTKKSLNYSHQKTCR